jgi:glycosyltransferase A (GT-A) superfamily protein (DUF2064 family)
LVVERAEPVDAGVGIGGWLKVANEVVALVTQFQASNAILNLLCDRPPGSAPTGAETAIVAKRAAADRHRAVHVGTGEPGIDADFLNTMAKLLTQVKVK